MSESIALVQLCRIGDIVSLLPIAKHMYDEGNSVSIVCAPEFAGILEATTYVRPIIHNTHHRDISGAAESARRRGCTRVIECQKRGGNEDGANGTENFQTEQWSRADYLEKFHELSLIFDKRDATGEAKAIAMHVPKDDGRPLLLCNFKGTSSPYPQWSHALKWVRDAFGASHRILDLTDVCLQQVHHLLGILELAEVLITVDTLHHHLAYATKTPTIVFSKGASPSGTPMVYYNAEPRSHWVYRCPNYADSLSAPVKTEIERIVRDKDYAPGRLVRTPENMRIRDASPSFPQSMFIGDSGAIAFDRIRISDANLSPARWRYNPALIRIDGKLLMAYRCQNHHNGQSHISLSWLDEHLQPCGKPAVLSLNRCAEDPRLWTWGGKLFMGTCDGLPGAGRQFATEITTDGNVVRDTLLPSKTRVEKNYLPFEHDGKRYCIYRFPHLANVHEVWELNDALKIQATHCGTRKQLAWKWGEMRGSTPPVRVGDEYFAFFHSSFRDTSIFPQVIYVTGWLSFQAEPPFSITAMSPRPIFWPDLASYGRGPTRAIVTFPCGAVFDGTRWIVSAGANDAYCELFCINHAELLKDAEIVERKREMVLA